MINGYIDVDLRPKVEVLIKECDGGFRRVTAILDTGFTGQLKLPSAQLEGLQKVHPTRFSTVSLADSSSRRIPVHTLVIDWDGEERIIEVLEMEGRNLVGMDMLMGNLTFIEGVLWGSVRIEPMQSRAAGS